jgi:DNA-binding transcriptional LysR family regulator
MNVRHLQNFLEILSTGSIIKAAQNLGISQPALTKSLQRLEEQIGAPLFTREARGMRPTVFADSLRDFAQATCIGVDQSMREIANLRTGKSGVATLCGPPVLAADLFPEVVMRVGRTHPDLQIRIIEQIDNLFTSLLEGEFEVLVATITSEVPRFGLNRMWLFDDTLSVIAAPGHPVTRLKAPSARQLRNFRWVFSNPGNLHRRRLEAFFEAENIALPKPVAETSSPSLIKAILERTDCIALMAKLGLKDELAQGRLVCVDLDSPLMKRPIGLIWRDTHRISAAAKVVLEAIEATCRDRGHHPRLET